VRLATDPELGANTGHYVSKKAKRLTPIAPGDTEELRRSLWEFTGDVTSAFLEG
jgi:hypothetical protein